MSVKSGKICNLIYVFIRVVFYLIRFFFRSSEPAYRGMMIAYVNVSVVIGIMLVFVLNTLMPWRIIALVALCLPIFTTIALVFVS